MRSPLSILTLLILILTLTHCTKSNSGSTTTTGTDTASIIGTWTWAYQTAPLWTSAPGDTNGSGQIVRGSFNPANTGISRTLIFDSAGHFTLIHNDSISIVPFNLRDSVGNEPDFLRIALPVQLLPGQIEETDTGYYRVGFGIVGCAITDTTTLTMQNVPYQALVGADTLLVHLSPCLSKVVDIYLRKN